VIEALLAMIMGLLLGLGSAELAIIVGNVKETLSMLGLIELLFPAIWLLNYANQVMATDPIRGLTNVIYAIIYYFLYLAFWGIGAELGTMVERTAEKAGYMAGKALRTLQ